MFDSGSQFQITANAQKIKTKNKILLHLSQDFKLKQLH